MNSKIPPFNQAAEEALLSCLLMNQDLLDEVMGVIDAEDFYFLRNQIIFRALLTLCQRGTAIEAITLYDHIKSLGKSQETGGATYIAELIDKAGGTVVYFQEYVKVVREKSLLRQVINFCMETTANCYRDYENIDHFLDGLESHLFTIAEQKVRHYVYSSSEIVYETIKKLEKMRESKDKVTGISSGLFDLDRVLGGFQNQDLVIVAGRPGHGKTSLSLGFMQHATIHLQNTPCLFFSLEMPREQLMLRMMCSEARLDFQKIRSGYTNERDDTALYDAAKKVEKATFFIDDAPNNNILSICATARRMKKRHDIKMVLIDYLQLVKGSKEKENRVQEVTDISWRLKGLARELDIPVIALSQLNRQVEYRTDKRPTLADLRESGCLSGDTEIYLPTTAEWRKIADVKIGEYVLALNETTWKLELRPVTRIWRNGIRQVFLLKTKLGRTIKATANHKFLSGNEWKRLDQFRLGDAIATPRTLPNIAENSENMGMSRLALLAHLLGNGCALPRQPLHCTHGFEELAYLVCRLAEQAFGDQLRPYVKKERTWYQTYTPASFQVARGKRNPLVEWLEGFGLYGKRSHEKFIPREVFLERNENIAIFLRHLWSTDGTIYFSNNHNPAIRYDSTSKEMVVGIHKLLLRLNITSILSEFNEEKGRIRHSVNISGIPDKMTFLTQIGTIRPNHVVAAEKMREAMVNKIPNTNRDIIPNSMILPLVTKGRKPRGDVGRQRCAQFAEMTGCEKLKRLSESHVYWDEIASIIPCGEEEVFDLTIDELHNFVANCIVSSNSIEQDSDVVLMLYRDEVYHPGAPESGKAEIIVAKHRNGPTGVAHCVFRPEYMRFESMMQPEYYTNGEERESV